MAATFEQIGLANQLVHEIYSLSNNWRDNAADYVAQISAGKDPAAVAAVMVGDAQQFSRRIGWITTAVTNHQATVAAALVAFNMALSDLTALRATLLGVANHTIAADLTTGPNVTTEANYILANVPSYVRLF